VYHCMQSALSSFAFRALLLVYLERASVSSITRPVIAWEKLSLCSEVKTPAFFLFLHQRWSVIITLAFNSSGLLHCPSP
jgi:hypothetical protein